MPIDHIVFDLGNVLIRVHPERFLENLAPRCSVYPESLFLSAPHLELMTGARDFDRYHRHVVEQYGFDGTRADLEAIWLTLIGQPVDGMRAIVDRLAGQGAVSLCSNTDGIHWDYCRTQLPHLAHMERTWLSFEMGTRKPGRAIFDALLADLDLPPEQVAFIDDTQENIVAASALGIRAIHADTAAAVRTGLRAVGVAV